MCMCFRYYLLIIFFSLFLLCELSLFLVWNAIKVYRQWVPCGCNSSYSFALIVLKHCRCFSAWNEDVMWFWYNSLIFFSHFFCFVNLSFFFLTWNAIKVYRQWVPCGRNSSYSFPSVVLKLCRCWGMEWRCTCGLGITIWLFFSLFLLCELKSLFLHEMLSKCIDSGYLVGATALTVLH